MGIIQVTARPSYYRELALQAQPEQPVLNDKVTVCFKIAGPTGWSGTRKQAAIRDVVASVLHDRLQRRARRPAGIEHIIHQDHDAVIDIKRDLRLMNDRLVRIRWRYSGKVWNKKQNRK